MKNVEHLASVTLAGLAALHNSAIENHSLPVDPVKKFASKDAAATRIGKLAEEYGLELIVINDGEVALVAGPDLHRDAPGEPEDLEGTDEEEVDPDEDAEGEVRENEPDAGAPFVKATKEELAAMDGPTRAAYRKARRKAARQARKAKQAA